MTLPITWPGCKLVQSLLTAGVLAWMMASLYKDELPDFFGTYECLRSRALCSSNGGTGITRHDRIGLLVRLAGAGSLRRPLYGGYKIW